VISSAWRTDRVDVIEKDQGRLFGSGLGKYLLYLGCRVSDPADFAIGGRETHEVEPAFGSESFGSLGFPATRRPMEPANSGQKHAGRLYS